MDELIFKQDAIDSIMSEPSEVRYPAFYAEKIKRLPSAQPEPRWIPVEERLPIKEFEEGRKNGTVYDLYPCLVTRYSTHTDEPRTRTYVCKSYFDGEDFMLHGGYAPDEKSDTENTLAWMPLPKRYEKPTIKRNFGKKKRGRRRIDFGAIGEALFIIALATFFLWACFR